MSLAAGSKAAQAAVAAQGSAPACRSRAQAPAPHHSAGRTDRAWLSQRHSRQSSRAAAAVQPTTAATDAPPVDAADTWASFAAAASGEWEGVTASFDAAGAPQQLPEYYVPQAYRDWGVELYDWQSQSSVLGGPEGLTATNRRMMPTVGCEADAVAFTQDARQLFSTAAGDGEGAPPTVAADGSYSAGPADLSAPDDVKAALEACLVLAPGQRRLRVVHNLQRMGAEAAWRLESVELHSERYDSPYRGKVELSGCGGGMKGFATSQPLGADALRGPWLASGLRYACSPDGGCHAETVSGEAWSAEGLAALLLHPLGAWSSSQAGGQGGADVAVAAGALLEDGRMVVATRSYHGGRLAAAELLTLARA